MNNADLFQRYKALNEQINEIVCEIRERNIDWRHLAEHGLKVQAITTYRRLHNTELKEAYNAVNSFLES
jgi:uncharacterized protein YggE